MSEKLTADALDEWRDHPVTQKLLGILRKGAASNRKNLQDQLWASGTCDPETMGRVKASEELVEDLIEAEAKEWEEWNEHFEQKRDSTA